MSTPSRGWPRHFFYRKEVLKTTWTFRLLALVCLIVLPWMTRHWWGPAVAHGLVCGQPGPPPKADAIIVENFDVNYLVFERAADLRREGATSKIVVPVQASSDSDEPNLVSAEIVQVMAKTARMGDLTMVPVREQEPISLNTAYRVRDFLRKEGVRSVLVVTPEFRSRRSELVYSAVLGPAGISTRCLPVLGAQTSDTWLNTLHGIEQVLEQYIKLEYYRVFILPRARATNE